MYRRSSENGKEQPVKEMEETVERRQVHSEPNYERTKESQDESNLLPCRHPSNDALDEYATQGEVKET